MPETETRMPRYHGKDKHRREYELCQGRRQPRKQASGLASPRRPRPGLEPTQVYSSKNWQEDPYAYHEVGEIPQRPIIKTILLTSSSYGTETYQDEGYDYDEHQAYVAYDEYDEGIMTNMKKSSHQLASPLKSRDLIACDCLLNNALILVAGLYTLSWSSCLYFNQKKS